MNIKQWCKEFTHNAIVHPLMMFLPKSLAKNLHNRNADWVYGSEHKVDAK